MITGSVSWVEEEAAVSGRLGMVDVVVVPPIPMEQRRPFVHCAVRTAVGAVGRDVRFGVGLWRSSSLANCFAHDDVDYAC